MIRLRGFAFLLAGLLFRLRFMHLYNAVRDNPFAYELGSAAGQLPPKMHAFGLSAVILFLIGIAFLVLDDVRWIRKRP